MVNNNLLPTRLPDKVNKPKWAKPRKSHGKASARSHTGAEAAEITADKAKQSSKTVSNQISQLGTLESSDDEDFLTSGTPPPRPGESQGGTTITLALRTPERLRGPPELIPTLASEPEASPEPQVQLPASTAPARMEEEVQKRRRIANKLYRNS